MKKKFLFVQTKPPYLGNMLQESLDIILTTAAFDQSVHLLFLDNGVFQIKQQQNVGLQGSKDTAAIFNALEIYDVHHVYAEVESLHERGLKPADLILPVREYFRKDIVDLMGRFQIIVGI